MKRLEDVLSEKAYLVFWTPLIMFTFGYVFRDIMEHGGPLNLIHLVSVSLLCGWINYCICENFEESIREEAEADYYLEGYRKGADDGGKRND